MGNFDKKAYDKAYNNANRTYIKASVSKDEYAHFMQSVQKAGITCTTSTYLKKLNADSILYSKRKAINNYRYTT